MASLVPDDSAERCPSDKSPDGFHDDAWYLFDEPCGYCGTTDLNVFIDGEQQTTESIKQVDTQRGETDFDGS